MDMIDKGLVPAFYANFLDEVEPEIKKLKARPADIVVHRHWDTCAMFALANKQYDTVKWLEARTRVNKPSKIL